MGMDLHGYRDRGLTVWKLEYERSQFYNSGRSLGLKTGGDDDVTPSVRLKTWEPGATHVSPGVSSLKSQSFYVHGQEEKEGEKSVLFTQAPKILDDAHPHWWGQISLLSWWIQTLISSRNTISEIPRTNVT